MFSKTEFQGFLKILEFADITAVLNFKVEKVEKISDKIAFSHIKS